MVLPSVKTMVARGFDVELAKKIRARMEKFRDSPKRGFDTQPVNCMADIDIIMNGNGVEFIKHGHNQKSPSISYVNMGDPYHTTVMWVDKSRFVIGCWGYYVEQGNYD